MERTDARTARSPAPPWLVRVGDRAAQAAVTVGLERWSRVVAVAVVPLLLPDGEFGALWIPFLGLAFYAAAAALIDGELLPRYGDPMAATSIILLVGPQFLPFLPFLLVAVASPAVRHGLGAGLAAGGAVGTLLLARLAVTGELAALGLPEVLPIALLLPLAGTTAAAAAQILQDRVVRERLVLQRANRLLSTLRTIADDLPGGLDATTVSAALLAELRVLPVVRGVVIYTDDDGTVTPTAATGLGQATLPVLRTDQLRALTTPPGRLLTASRLPVPLQEPLRIHLHWMAFPLGGEPASPAGVVLVGGGEAAPLLSVRGHLAGVAADASLSLENARLFEGTRSRATNAARRWVAADLHDGVAQSLAHLRLELELLARDAPDDPELARLAGVAGSALTDLRDTIAGLRAPAGADLQARLVRHVTQIQSPHGPQVDVHIDGAAVLSTDQADELLRIAQEALSNALRHAGASRIAVRLTERPDHVELRVVDDGRGLDGVVPAAGVASAVTAPDAGATTGLGMRTMRDRAERLGASLRIESPTSGGTSVHVAFDPTAKRTGKAADR